MLHGGKDQIVDRKTFNETLYKLCYEDRVYRRGLGQQRSHQWQQPKLLPREEAPPEKDHSRVGPYFLL